MKTPYRIKPAYDYKDIYCEYSVKQSIKVGKEEALRALKLGVYKFPSLSGKLKIVPPFPCKVFYKSEELHNDDYGNN